MTTPDSAKTNSNSQMALTGTAPEVVVGTLVSFDDDGVALVDWPGAPNQTPCSAISTTVYSRSDVGRAVALLFANGDPHKPVIVGLVRQPLDSVFEETEAKTVRRGLDAEPRIEGPGELSVERDGKRLTLSADREVVIQCGKASITLTRAGKVLIRGEYVLSRSCGTNKLMGGSVHIN